LKIATVLRDHRQKGTASITDMNRELLDLLADIADEIARRRPEMTDITFHVISGYRAPETNKRLRRQKGRGGQAENSAHTRGDAIDIRVPGVDRKELRDIAWCLQRGGVGDYPGNDFVHVDVWKKITRNANTRNFPNGERYRAWGWSPDPGQCAVPQPSPG
jgi:uncharacterized protein YcbK (DUF882 family)